MDDVLTQEHGSWGFNAGTFEAWNTKDTEQGLKGFVVKDAIILSLSIFEMSAGGDGDEVVGRSGEGEGADDDTEEG